MSNRQPYKRRRRPARRRLQVCTTPLARAVADPRTLLDRFILGLALGPPLSRAGGAPPAMRSLTSQLRPRDQGEPDPDE